MSATSPRIRPHLREHQSLDHPSVKRLLVSLLNSPDFKDLLQTFRAAVRAGADPERWILNALERASHQPRDYMIGLALMAELSRTELDLCCVLVKYVGFKGVTPFWKYDRTAAFVLRHRLLRTWFGCWLRPRRGVSNDRRLSRIRAGVQERWHQLEPKLSRCLDRSLAIWQSCRGERNP